jgi:hypothetical protein
MGRAARNPSQRAQTMGFAQLNPSYWDTTGILGILLGYYWIKGLNHLNAFKH